MIFRFKSALILKTALILAYILFVGCNSKNSIFIEKLPYDCRIGVTTKDDLSKLTNEPIFGNSFTDSEKRYGFYFDSNNGTLKTLVISKVPKNWIQNGIKKGMSYNDLIKIFDDIPYSDTSKEDGEYWYTIHFIHQDLKYSFGFPYRTNDTFNEYKDKLSNIEISRVE